MLKHAVGATLERSASRVPALTPLRATYCGLITQPLHA